MRATLTDVVRSLAVRRHPNLTLGDWWLEWPEWPGRRRYWWREVLFEPGRGWLRWGMVQDTVEVGWYDPPEQVTWMPPARRLATWLRYRATLALPWNRADARFLSGGSLGEWSAWYQDPERHRLWKEG